MASAKAPTQHKTAVCVQILKEPTESFEAMETGQLYISSVSQ